VIPGIVVAAVLAAVSTGTAASDGQSTQIFRTAVSLVGLNVTVQDGKSRYVTELQLPDFAVFEDGVKQDVRFFETASVPIDLIVLLDTSSSMSDKMSVVQTAARGVLDTLRPGDRASIVAFNDRVDVLQPLTSDREVLARAVKETQARGHTALHSAIYVALKHFGRMDASDSTVRRRAIAVLSDGQDTASPMSFDDVLALARETGVNIYTVRLRSREDGEQIADFGLARFLSESDSDMRTLARETGALSFFPLPDQLQGVYASIAKELVSQYSIGYEPVNRKIDGRFHRVEVRIVGRPDLRARTRLGYMAVAPTAR
jgi:Ca-activated chloride channel family protein